MWGKIATSAAKAIAGVKGAYKAPGTLGWLNIGGRIGAAAGLSSLASEVDTYSDARLTGGASALASLASFGMRAGAVYAGISSPGPMFPAYGAGVARFNPARLAAVGGGHAARGIAKLPLVPYKMARATWSGTFGLGKEKGFLQALGPGNHPMGGQMATMGMVKHDVMPMLAFGGAVGVGGALMARPGGRRSRTPMSGLDPSRFGGGIAFGRSALRSPTVMGGQSAVTTKMLQRRRV